MRRLKRNQRYFTYCNFLRKRDAVDENGYKNGHQIIEYDEPKQAKGNIRFTGRVHWTPYGFDDDYAVEIVPDIPIKEIKEETKIIIDGKEYFVSAVLNSVNEQKLECR